MKIQKNHIFRDCIFYVEYSFDHNIFKDTDYDKIRESRILKSRITNEFVKHRVLFMYAWQMSVSLIKSILSCRHNYYFFIILSLVFGAWSSFLNLKNINYLKSFIKSKMEEITDTNFEFISGFQFKMKYHNMEVKDILDWKKKQLKDQKYLNIIKLYETFFSKSFIWGKLIK